MIAGTIHRETPAALLFHPHDAKRDDVQWVPRSQVDRLSRKHAGTPTEASIRMQSWLMKKKGWEDYDDGK